MEEDLSSWWTLPAIAAFITASAVPIIIIINQISGSGRRGLVLGSRLKSGEAASEEVKEILRKIDPIDSLYFDVSVSRHLLEEGDIVKGLEWLDPNHALGELKRSYISKFLTAEEFDEFGGKICKIKEAVDGGNLAEAHAIIVPLQEKLAEKAYTTFQELDPLPEGYIDARYKGIRDAKITEWRAKGYHEGLIEKALKWADEWPRGLAGRFIKEPTLRKHFEETLYPEALDMADEWIEAMIK